MPEYLIDYSKCISNCNNNNGGQPYYLAACLACPYVRLVETNNEKDEKGD